MISPSFLPIPSKIFERLFIHLMHPVQEVPFPRRPDPSQVIFGRLPRWKLVNSYPG